LFGEVGFDIVFDELELGGEMVMEVFELLSDLFE
jgi:hypothetical protein